MYNPIFPSIVLFTVFLVTFIFKIVPSIVLPGIKYLLNRKK